MQELPTQNTQDLVSIQETTGAHRKGFRSIKPVSLTDGKVAITATTTQFLMLDSLVFARTDASHTAKVYLNDDIVIDDVFAGGMDMVKNMGGMWMLEKNTTLYVEGTTGVRVSGCGTTYTAPQ